MKKSFAMLFAIAFVVVLGTIGIIMMNLASLSVKHTADDYLSAQGELYARSATEHAIAALESRNFATDGCINRIDINATLYEINMTFHYFLTNCPVDCNCSTITTKESNGTVMINTYVTSKADPNIRFFKQTLQKP